MKLWHSFSKELLLASRGFYFYVEIFIAVLLLVVLLFAVPEEFESKQDEYVSFEASEAIYKQLLANALEDDLDGKLETVELKDQGDIFTVEFIETEKARKYLFENKEDMIRLTKADRPSLGVHVFYSDDGSQQYEYYLQGYEAEKLRNVYRIFHVNGLDTLIEANDAQEVRSLGESHELLNDRENVVPSILTFNGSLMGLFIVAAYVFLDKQEGIIKAYAITASSVWHYLMSKVGVILTTSIISSLIIVVPIMGLQPNYPLMLLLLLTSGLFISTLGLLISSFYKNLTGAFGAIYVVMITLMLPNIAYFIPSWEPFWIKLIPTHPLIQGFKETVVVGGDTNYTLLASLGFLVAGVVLFFITERRFKKNLGA